MPIEPINLQGGKIEVGATDYPVKHNDSMDLQESKINEMVDAVNDAVATVSANAANIATVAGIAGQVTAVANQSAEIEVVAENIAEVNAVGDNIASVVVAAQNIPAIIAAPAAASAAGLSAGQAAASAGAAAQITGLNTVLSFTNQKALCAAIHMTAAASGSSGIQAYSSVNNDFGTSDFTLVVEDALPSYSPSVTVALLHKRVANGTRWNFYINSANSNLGFLVLVGGVTLLNIASTANLASLGLAAWVRPVFGLSVIRETAASAGSAVFTVNGVQLGDAVAIPAGVPASFDNSGILSVHSTGTAADGRAESITAAWRIFNRSVSVTGMLDMVTNGLPWGDVGGSNLPIYSSNFSSGVDGYGSEIAVTLAGNVDGISGIDDWLRVTVDSTGSNRGFQKTVSGLMAGKWYRITGKAMFPSANVSVDSFTIRAHGGTEHIFTGAFVADQPRDTVIDFKLEGLALINAAGIRFYIGDSPSLSTTSTIGDIVYLKDIKITQLGCTVRHEPEGIQAGGQWLDFANGNHAMAPVEGATVLRPPRFNQQRGTNAWTATAETQYVAGFNRAVLPASSATMFLDIHSTGSVTVHIGDGVDVDRYGASIALTAGRNRVAILTPFNDGTNLKLTLTPTGAFTGTLKTTCDYKLQEA